MLPRYKEVAVTDLRDVKPGTWDYEWNVATQRYDRVDTAAPAVTMMNETNWIRGAKWDRPEKGVLCHVCQLAYPMSRVTKHKGRFYCDGCKGDIE